MVSKAFSWVDSSTTSSGGATLPGWLYSNVLLFVGVLTIVVFIHELGHYWMARRVGMRVESFGIGFGRPIVTWLHNGVKWNICWLPFGGYVKIAGMEKETIAHCGPGE